MPDNNLNLDLYSLVTAVRDELESVDRQRRLQSQQALFQLAEMELELNFVVTQKAGGKGKLDLKVFSLEADAGVEREKIQKIRLKFNLADSKVKDEDMPVGSRFHSSTHAEGEKSKIDPL
jgi:hypothetical protein